MLTVGETQGGLNDEVLRYMVQKTVEEHLKKEKFYKPKGIKGFDFVFY
jgi:type III restriction enzyme